MLDSHFHSHFSFDSKSNPESIVKFALKHCLRTITFTDHLDYDANLNHDDFDFNIEEYFKTLENLKKKYKNEIEILIGAEFGIQPQLIEKYKKVARDYPWDFILMSIHTVDQRDLAVDGFIEAFPPLEGLKRYYAMMSEMLDEYQDFDSLAHIDYIDRYYIMKGMALPNPIEYMEEVERVYSKVLKLGKVIELNSQSLRRGMGFFHPKEELLRRYIGLGGKSATFGSDAHVVNGLGAEFDNVVSKAGDMGLKNISIFRKRRRYDFEINDFRS